MRRSARRVLLVHRRYVDFAAVRNRVHGMVDPIARREALAVLADARKWDAVICLFEALEDPDPDVQARAVQLLEAWTQDFNRSQLSPSSEQLDRVRVLLERHAGKLPAHLVWLLRFTLGGVAPRS